MLRVQRGWRRCACEAVLGRAPAQGSTTPHGTAVGQAAPAARSAQRRQLPGYGRHSTSQHSTAQRGSLCFAGMARHCGSSRQPCACTSSVAWGRAQSQPGRSLPEQLYLRQRGSRQSPAKRARLRSALPGHGPLPVPMRWANACMRPQSTAARVDPRRQRERETHLPYRNMPRPGSLVKPGRSGEWKDTGLPLQQPGARWVLGVGQVERGLARSPRCSQLGPGAAPCTQRCTVRCDTSLRTPSPLPSSLQQAADPPHKLRLCSLGLLTGGAGGALSVWKQACAGAGGGGRSSRAARIPQGRALQALRAWQPAARLNEVNAGGVQLHSPLRTWGCQQACWTQTDTSAGLQGRQGGQHSAAGCNHRQAAQ